MSFFVACITSESRTELTLNSSSRISRTCETYTDGNALRSGEMSYRNNLKSQTTTNWRTQPFLTPPIFGTLTYPSYAVPIPRVGSIPNGRLAETTHTPFMYKTYYRNKDTLIEFYFAKNKTKKTDYFDRGARDTSAVLCRNKAYGTRSRTLRTRLPASLIQPSRTYSDYTWWALKMFGRETGATSALVADWLDRERLKTC